MLLVEIGTYLAARSAALPFAVVLTRGTNLFEGDLAASPDAGVGIFEYGGPPPEHDLGTENTRIESARFQVEIRHATHATGRLLAQQLANALVAIGNETLSGVYYLSIAALQSNPTMLPRDELKRWRWTWNFEAMKAVSAS